MENYSKIKHVCIHIQTTQQTYKSNEAEFSTSFSIFLETNM